jgi:hypothetical protein
LRQIPINGQKNEQQKRAVPPRRGGFTGSFSGLDLLNLVQMCALTGVSGRLSVRSGSRYGYIYLKDGQIVHAICDDVDGLEGFTLIMSWHEGEVQLEPDIPTPTRSIDIAWEGLLIRAMANLDEEAQRTFSTEPPPEAARTVRLQRLYSEVISWPGLVNFVIYDRRSRAILRPSNITPKIAHWTAVLVELYEKADRLDVFSGGQEPSMISVRLDGNHWVIIPHEDYLLALQSQRFLDTDSLFVKLKAALVRSL